MDALRRAEAEKKQAAKNKHAHQADTDSPEINVKENPSAADTEDHDDEDLGATVKLDRLPLPISKMVPT